MGAGVGLQRFPRGVRFSARPAGRNLRLRHLFGGADDLWRAADAVSVETVSGEGRSAHQERSGVNALRSSPGRR